MGIESIVCSQAPRPEACPTTLRSDELQFVEQLVAGSQTGWEEFVSRYATLVRGSVEDAMATCGHLTDPASVDDLTAEVFSALLENDCAPLRGFQGRSSLGTYVRVIAVRVAIRQSMRRRPCTDGQVSMMLADHRHQGPPQVAISAEERQILGELIEQLSERQKEMIRLHYFEGLTHQQISAKMHVPIGSIGPTLKRAEQRLRSSLDRPPMRVSEASE